MAPQPGSQLVPTTEKPSLTRSRSSTAPSKRPHPTLDISATRPQFAARSHSYLSPADVKPRTSHTLPHHPPATSSSRLHIPGKSSHHKTGDEHRHSRHRHTHSDLHGSRSRSHQRDKTEALPHLTTGIVAGAERRGEPSKMPYDLWGGRANEIKRIASNRSYQPRPDASRVEEAATLRRTNSDPKRRAQLTQRSQIEELLDEAEARKMANRAAVSQRDVDRMRRIHAEAEEELQQRLAAVNKASVDITRRLDYTYYNLLEKVGNLVALVQSFQSLSSQTKDVIDHFTSEAATLEHDVKAKVRTFKTSFDEREERIRRLEERGASANAKARELGARLEQARQRVEAWEKKEGEEKRRMRSWFWTSTWTVVSVILVVIFVGLTWREWRGKVGMGGMALMGQTGTAGDVNRSMFLDREGLKRLKVPGAVKSILSGVADRRSPAGMASAAETASVPTTSLKDDARLRILDEL